jgi:hypothetical protein
MVSNTGKREQHVNVTAFQGALLLLFAVYVYGRMDQTELSSADIHQWQKEVRGCPESKDTSCVGR